MTIRRKTSTAAATFLAACLGTSALTPAHVLAAPAQSQSIQDFSISAQSLQSALLEFSRQSQSPVVASASLLRGVNAPAVQGRMEEGQALMALLDGSGLVASRSSDGGWAISRKDASDPQSGSAAGDGADGTVQALIVTAQKREENIQDVPIAMSAFTQEDLTRSQVAGGPDLITQVPNMTFTKTNFSSYSIQLRGIGTQAISATVDPAVAVAFNNTPFIRNRFFEQEFYDLQRVEVLRGPQGTLYGRNATAGVVNLISQKPKFTYEAKLSADAGNYSSHRLEGMLNIPLVEDKVALRVAGAWTKRDGYTTNELTGNPIDGRDLWSTRISLRFTPTDRLDANLIWEHFEENDDRLRSGKQLCKMDVVNSVAGFATPNFYGTLPEYGLPQEFSGVQPSFSQGCAPASLYSPDSFQKTNPLALPYFVPLGAAGLPVSSYPVDSPLHGHTVDPYASRTQSMDLRVIEAAVDPSYRAKTDIVELQASYELTDALTLNSETSWSSDFIFSSQDYNRFAGAPQAFGQNNVSLTTMQYRDRGILSEDGVFCDPQIGCSDRLVAMDLSTARSAQFSQELRLASDFDGPFNFSVGGNFLRYDTEDKYYVFINTISMVSAFDTVNNLGGPGQWVPGVTDNRDCLTNGMVEPDYNKAQPILRCTYIDPNPINSLNDLGHNYFLSRNPYKLISYAAFGEVYYNLMDNLKVTAGLRWTVDKKQAPLRPSWLLAANTAGYPVIEVVNQEWRKPTGRVAVDWKPNLSFTDETMIYASLAHGYKAGGMNPPPYGKAILTFGITADIGDLVTAASALHPKTFDAEYVNALELGAKNTLLDGRLTANLATFYYDYKGYQLSQIVDRSAVTQNFDATVWGVELESDWRAAENLRFGLKLGYERTKVADGERAIDVMDRTAGNTAWVLHKPFPSIPSNCVVPAWLLVGNTINPNIPNNNPNPTNPDLVNVGGLGGGNPTGCEEAYLLGNDPATAAPFRFDPYNTPGPDALGVNFRSGVNYPAWSSNVQDYPCWPTDPATGQLATLTTRDYPGVDPACLAAMSNNGEGFFKNLSGKELPNAPHMTATVTADYTIPLPQNWLMTLHTDLYYQSESWTRIFNTEGYDKIKAYSNINLAAIFTNEDAGWKVMAYVKNVLDRDSITGAFLNSDDSGLTTNVFLTEPRLYGLRVTKDFAGGPWWTGANLDHAGPYPLTVEIGGQVQRLDGHNENLSTAWARTLPETIATKDVQNREFDNGDGRSLKVTWRPNSGPWSVSAAIRNGRTNNDTARDNKSSVDIIEACRFFPSSPFAPACQPPYLFRGVLDVRFWNFVEATSWADAESGSAEQHEIVDFAVGYDFGLGGGLSSNVSAGLRYADFSSRTSWAANAQTDWDVPEGWGQYPYPALTSLKRRHAKLSADRKFTGAGPTLSWNAAETLWGDERTGRLNVDWSVTAGALFGTRRTNVAGEDKTVNHEGVLVPFSTLAQDRSKTIITSLLPESGSSVEPINIARSKRATVPLGDLSLGLSYEVGRIKVGTGYRWERYFDVLDVGQDEAKKADRTIDGPYFKIAVGFGG